MINYIKTHLANRRQRKILDARLKGYGYAWAHYQLEHWPLEDLEALVTPSSDDYGPEVEAWEWGLLEAIRDIEAFLAYRHRYGQAKRQPKASDAAPVDPGGRRFLDSWSDFHGDRNIPGRYDFHRPDPAGGLGRPDGHHGTTDTISPSASDGGSCS